MPGRVNAPLLGAGAAQAGSSLSPRGGTVLGLSKEATLGASWVSRQDAVGRPGAGSTPEAASGVGRASRGEGLLGDPPPTPH